MSKKAFLDELREALSGLPSGDIQKTIDYYAEIIDDAVEEGEAEDETVARLGSIDEIAKRIIDETPIHKLVSKEIKRRSMSAPVIVLLVLGSPVWLSFLIAAFAIIFSLYIAIWSVAASLFAVFAALAVSGVGMLIAALFLIRVRPAEGVFALGAAFAVMGLVIFMFYISVWVAKMIVKMSVLAVRELKSMIMRKGSAENES